MFGKQSDINLQNNKEKNSNLLAASNIIQSIHQDGQIFPERKLLEGKNSIPIKRSLDKYTVMTGNVLGWYKKFTLINLKDKKTNQLRLAKVYFKNVYLKWKSDIERELLILKNLKNSRTVLRILEIIECKGKIFWVYENATPFKTSMLYEKKLHSDKLALDALIGLNEINSFGYSLLNFNSKNILITENNEIKIAHFENLRKIGGKILDRNLKKKLIKQKWVCPSLKESLDVNSSVDVFSLGYFLLEMTKIEFSIKSDELDTSKKEFFIELEQDQRLPHEEKNLLSRLLEEKYFARLKLSDIILHSVFSNLLAEDFDLKDKIHASYSDNFTERSERLPSELLSFNSITKAEIYSAKFKRSPRKKLSVSVASTKIPNFGRSPAKSFQRKRSRMKTMFDFKKPKYKNFLINKNSNKPRTPSSFGRRARNRKSKTIILGESGKVEILRAESKKSRKMNFSVRKRKERKLQSGGKGKSKPKGISIWKNFLDLLGCNEKNDFF